MRKIVRLLLIIGTIFGVLIGTALAQEGGRFYHESGHTLDSRVGEFFDSHGGLEIWGYPISKSFIDSSSGRIVQYMLNGRFEYHPAPPGGEPFVTPSLLGEFLGGWGTPVEAGQLPVGPDSGCRYYPESQHYVCHAFLAFYEAHGGPAQFGYPISEFGIENGRIVQYFQGFRLDWHPDALDGRTVQVAPLGRIHFERSGFDPDLLRPDPPDERIQYRVLELHLSTSVWQPVMGSSGEQQLYVVVRDQNFRPVQDVVVTARVLLADELRTVVMPATDENGIAQRPLAFTEQPAGTFVLIEYTAVFGELISVARDSFRIWW